MWNELQKAQFKTKLTALAVIIGDAMSDTRVVGYLMVLGSQDFDEVDTLLDDLTGKWRKDKMPTPGMIVSMLADKATAATMQNVPPADPVTGIYCEACLDTGWQACWCPGNPEHPQHDPAPYQRRRFRPCGGRHLSSLNHKTKQVEWFGHEEMLVCDCRPTNPNYLAQMRRLTAARAERE